MDLEKSDERYITMFQLLLSVCGAVAVTICSAFAIFPTKEQVQTEMDLRSKVRDVQFKTIDYKLDEIGTQMRDMNNFLRSRK